MKIDGLMDRRDFMGRTTTLLAAVSVFSLFDAGCGRQQEGGERVGLTMQSGRLVLDLEQPPFSALKTVGRGVRLEIDGVGEPLIVTRVGTDLVTAVSSVCTHAGGRIGLPADGRLVCESGHGATFDLHGRVLTGPARTDLERFAARIAEGSVIIDLKG